MSPRLSIVIPSRDRAELLRHAVLSSLAQQGFNDLEVVVVDQESTDHTPEVLDEVPDDRLVRVRIPRQGSQANDWEAALKHASGEWLLLLGDDDAVVPSFARRIARVADSTSDPVIVFRRAYYHHHDWPESGLRNHLTVYPADGALSKRSASDLRHRLLVRRDTDDVPLVGNNAVIKREAWARVRAITGRAHRRPMPDYSFAACLLALDNSCTVVDQPLIVIGGTPDSAGHSVDRRNEAGQAFLSSFETRDNERLVPLGIPVVANLKAASIVAGLNALPPAISNDLELDLAGYFASCREDLQKVSAYTNVRSDWQEWRGALRQAPPGVRRDVARRVAAERVRRIGRLGRSALVRSLGLSGRPAERRARGGLHSDFLHLDGDAEGFSNIAEAAAEIESRVLSQPPMTSL